jgi:hypothetical protein
LLRVGRKRPHHGRIAEQSRELAPPHRAFPPNPERADIITSGDDACCESMQIWRPMSRLGHSRHFDRAPLTSGLPRTPDMLSARRHVAKVPKRYQSRFNPDHPRCTAATKPAPPFPNSRGLALAPNWTRISTDRPPSKGRTACLMMASVCRCFL